MDLLHLLIDPFIEYGFMRRALLASITLSISASPLGIFLLLRRMSLVGDALSHAVLPGVAIGFLISGTSLIAMGTGGFIAGLFVAVLSGFVSRRTGLKEDASFAGFYIGSLALGVILVSLKGSSVDLLHFLFGSILAIDATSLISIGIFASISLIILALIYRILIIESFDVTFLKVKAKGYWGVVHAIFLGLVVLNLVIGFQILGTLMTVGILVLPATTARFWCRKMHTSIILTVLIGIFSSFTGLVWTFYFNIPSGPAIILVISLCFAVSVCFGSNGGIFNNIYKDKQLN